VNHKARFEGWNFGARWIEQFPKVWDGKQFVDEAPVAKSGERPLLAVIGGDALAGKVAVQFVEANKVLAGEFSRKYFLINLMFL
jgi:hypothetical protein